MITERVIIGDARTQPPDVGCGAHRWAGVPRAHGLDFVWYEGHPLGDLVRVKEVAPQQERGVLSDSHS